MRKYFLELFAIGLVDSEGRINTEHMTSDALMTAMKTMEELTQMKMDRLVLETTMEMILCMFESCDTEEFTEILGKLLGGKQTSKVTAHLEALEELLTEEEYRGFLAEYLGYLTVNVAEFIRSTIIENEIFDLTLKFSDIKINCLSDPIIAFVVYMIVVAIFAKIVIMIMQPLFDQNDDSCFYEDYKAIIDDLIEKKKKASE